MTIHYFISYLSILIMATIVPGPNMLLALNHGANHGIAKTLYSAIGNLIGNFLLALVSILGLGVILLSSVLVFNIIKWAGIVYLIYLGIKMILAKPGEIKALKSEQYKNNSHLKLFIDGFVIAIGNPKGIVFFTALFPQFIDIQTADISKFSIIFITLLVVAFSCYMLYALFGNKLSRLFQGKKFQNIFNKISGSAFIGIGIALAFSKTK